LDIRDKVKSFQFSVFSFKQNQVALTEN